MRVHCLARDPDFWRKSFASVPATILNGKWINNVIMADDERGVVEIIDTDASGQPLRRDGRVVTKELHGHVEIVGRRLGERVN